MKNTGGALSFDATINDSDFKKTINSIINDMQRLSNSAQKGASVLDKSFSSGLNNAQNTSKRVSNSIVSDTDAINSSFNSLARTAAAAFAGLQLAQLPGQIVKVRGEFQQLEIALTTMLQSSERGGKLMQDIIQTAATTPFSMKSLATGAKQMIAFGSQAENVVGELRMLGDVAAGLSIPLGDLVYVYGTLRTQQRAYAIDMRQFALRGIPIYEEVAKVMNVTTAEVMDLVSAGKVGFAEVEKAFQNMTAAGSMFGGLMDAQSKSIPGLIERLKDSIAIMYNEIGKENQGVIESTIKLGATAVENYRLIGSILAGLVATYGAYRTAVIVTTAAQRGQLGATVLLQRATALLNTTMLANPYVAITTAVVALGAAIWALHDATTAQERAQESLNKINEQANENLSKMQSESARLVGIIRDENQTNYARQKAYDDLVSKYKNVVSSLSLYEIQAMSTADAQRFLNQMAQGFEGDQLQKAIDEARKRLENLQKTYDNMSGGKAQAKVLDQINEQEKVLEGLEKKQREYNKASDYAALSLSERLDLHKKEVANLEATKRKLIEAQKEASKAEAKNLERSIQRINGLLDGAKGKIDAINKALNPDSANTKGGDLSFWEGEVSRLTAERGKIEVGDIGSAKWRELTQQIKNAQKQVEKYSLAEERVSKRDQPRPFGSIAYWNQVARKAQEAAEKINPDKDPDKFSALDERRKIAELNAEYAKANLMPYGSLEYWEAIQRISQNILKSTPASDTEGISAQKDIIANAQKNIEEIRKSQAVRSFDEELQYKRQQYELYEKWATHISKEQADSQFSNLIANGQSFSEYLRGEISKVEEKVKLGETIDLEQFDKLKEALRVAEFAKTPLEEFNLTLEKIRDTAPSLTDELISVREELEKLTGTDALSLEKRSILEDRESQIIIERQKLLSQFLTDTLKSEERLTAIQKHYNDLRTGLDERHLDKKSKAYQDALKHINDAEKEELDSLANEIVKTSKAYQELQRAISRLNSADTKERINLERQALKGLVVGSKEYLDQLERIRLAEKEHKEESYKAWVAISGMIEGLGAELSEYDGALGKIGQTLSGLANIAGGVSNTIGNMDSYLSKDGGLNARGYIAAAQSIISMINGLIAANKRRREQEKKFAEERIGFENEYRISLIRSYREGGNDNPFYQNYDEQIKRGVYAYKVAFDQYQDAIDKLEKGRAKERQKDVVDGKSFWKSVGSGATGGLIVGAAVGGGILSWATAVGGAIGGAIGAGIGFFMKKKKDVYGSLLERYPDLLVDTEEGWIDINEELARALIANNQVDDSTKQLLENALALQEELQAARQQIRDTIYDLTGDIGDRLKKSLVDAFRAGNDAAQAMRNTVGEIIADMAMSLVFSRIFGPMLDKFMKEAEESMLSEDGDGDLTDDMIRLADSLGEGANAAVAYLDAVSEALERAGFDNPFQKTNGSGGDKSLSGALRGMSEETAGVLAGQFNAIRIYQAQMATDMRISVSHLAVIAGNTSYNVNLLLLNDIRDEINGLRKDMKGRGLGL